MKTTMRKFRKPNVPVNRPTPTFSVWAGFNPDAPIDGFYFADITKLAMSELAEIQSELRVCRVPEWIVHGLERGVGVHHSGMHGRYF